MAVHSGTADHVAREERAADSSAVYAEGLTAGLVGAATIAIWFLIVDTIGGRPLYTPAVLGSALLRGVDTIADPAAVPIDLETVLTFSWLHVLAFLLIGVSAAKLLELAERDTHLGFGIVLLFVVFSAGF